MKHTPALLLSFLSSNTDLDKLADGVHKACIWCPYALCEFCFCAKACMSKYQHGTMRERAAMHASHENIGPT